MKSEFAVRAEYSNAKKIAEELDSIAGSVVNVSESDYENIVASLKNAWQGENAEKYMQKCNKVKQQLLDAAKEIREAAGKLRSEAKATYDTEMKALELVKKQSQERGGDQAFGESRGGSR